MLSRFLISIPKVKKELHHWATLAHTMPEPLRTQALTSIEHKAFHCIGGSVYAHYPDADSKVLLPLIVALQTISDYLDNLCDRMQVSDPNAFRRLHQAFKHAMTPNSKLINYYELYPYSEDIYLPSLVRSCQNLVGQIPNWPDVQAYALFLAELYCELQVLKHVFPDGEKLLKHWAEEQQNQYQLSWYEWSAACGSTLGIFLAMALGFQPQSDHKSLFEAYFPWIQGLHILLDYLIDLEEDAESGDLNFVSYYPSSTLKERSLVDLAQKAKVLSTNLPHSHFHSTVVDGLIALYGSDPKVAQQNQGQLIRHMVKGSKGLLLLKLCKLLRKVKFI